MTNSSTLNDNQAGDPEGRLRLWWNPVVEPLVKAIYRKDIETGTALVESIRGKLAASDLDPDLRQAASFKLCYVSNQLYRITGTKSRPQAVSDVITGLSEPSRGPVSAGIRARLLIQARTIAETLGEGELPEDEFRDLYATASRINRPPEFWHYVSTWGYIHDRIEFVKTALAELTINSDGYQSDLVWQRANLLHLLMEGRTLERDVVELIKRIDNKLQWESISRLIWPAVEKAGLHDSEQVKQAITRMEQRFADNPARVPRRDIPTKGIRR